MSEAEALATIQDLDTKLSQAWQLILSLQPELGPNLDLTSPLFSAALDEYLATQGLGGKKSRNKPLVPEQWPTEPPPPTVEPPQADLPHSPGPDRGPS